MDKLDLEQFKEMNPCPEGYRFVLDLKTTDLDDIFLALMDHRPRWANWLISRLLNRKNRIRYAVFAARRSLPLFERKHPDDNRPRLAIEAAEKCIEHDTVENRAVAKSAAFAAAFAASYEAAHVSAAMSAAYATESAAVDAAESAAESSAYVAAYVEAHSAASTWLVEMEEIVKYGLELLMEQ